MNPVLFGAFRFQWFLLKYVVFISISASTYLGVLKINPILGAFRFPVITTQNGVFISSGSPTYFWVLFTNPLPQCFLIDCDFYSKCRLYIRWTWIQFPWCWCFPIVCVIYLKNFVFISSGAPIYFWVLYTNPLLLVLSWLPMLSIQNVILTSRGSPTYFWVLYMNPLLQCFLIPCGIYSKCCLYI